MKPMKIQWPLVALMACVLSACGGSSSSNDSPTGGNPIVNSPPLTITPENAEQASGEVMKALDRAFSAGDSALDFGGVIGARIEVDSAVAANVALDVAHRARGWVLSASDRVAVGAVITETEECSAGGSTRVSINTGSLSQVEFTNALQAGSIPAGTSVSIFFDQCGEPGQPLLNGGMTIVFQQFSVDGEIGLGEFTMEFSAIFAALETPVGTIDGDISFLLTSSVGSSSSEIGGDALQFTVGADSLGLLQYLATATQDSVALVQSFQFALNVSGLGQVSVQTLVNWRTNLLEPNPISGSLRILGADDTSITVTALDEVSVQLEVDSDGDGMANVTIITTWAELNPPGE